MTWRYFRLDGAGGSPWLLIRANPNGMPNGFDGTWDPDVNGWAHSSYLDSRLRGLGGDSDDPYEIDAASVPAIQAAIEHSWAQWTNRDSAARYFVRSGDDNAEIDLVRVRDWGHRGVHAWNATGFWIAVPDRQAILAEIEPVIGPGYEEVDESELASVLARLNRNGNPGVSDR